MGPFNYPLNETFATLIPALIMGNTAIVKTPKIGKLLFSPLLEAFRDSFPRGVVNILSGDRRLVKPIIESGRINVLAFIGSSSAADALRVIHPHPHRLRCILGLDAKNPGVLLESADMDLAAREILSGSLAFNGQRCTALKILFAHRSRVDELLERLVEGIATLKVGMPFDEGVNITPLPVPGKTDYLTELVRDAEAKGARVMNPGGGTVAQDMFYPALLYPVDDRMRVFHEEQFGPVVPVAAFDDVSEVLEYVVNSKYGQQISLFGEDVDEMARLIDPLVNQVSRVNINSYCQRGPDKFPFTGRKDSAEGTLSVSDALRCFSIRSVVAARGSEGNRQLLTRILRERKSNFLSTDFIF
jgi:glyceraldehyde-3-phosphate dehydrogenase (NADP+)